MKSEMERVWKSETENVCLLQCSINNSPEIIQIMEKSRIRSYCQFCLKQQTKIQPTSQLSNDMKRNFFLLTRKKFDDVRFNSHICSDSCLLELKNAIEYRNVLLTNQKTLEDLYNLEIGSDELQDDDSPVMIKEETEVYIASVKEEFDACDEFGLVKVEIEELDEPIALNISSRRNPRRAIGKKLSEVDSSPSEDCSENDKSEDEQMASSAARKDKESLVCTSCNKSFSYKTSLQKHIRNCLKSGSSRKPTTDGGKPKYKYKKKVLEEPIKCSECDMQFVYMAYYRTHFRNIHQTDQSEICPVCAKICKNSRSYAQHMLIHQEFRKYECDVCSKRFRCSGSLRRHKFIHDEVKPFKCTFKNCSKTFTQSTTLYIHLDMHNRVRYFCDRCGQSRGDKRSLRAHIADCMRGIAKASRQPKFPRGPRGCNGIVHEKYKCVVDGCVRDFAGRQQLGNHLKKTHGMRFESFETTCLVCNLVFDSVGEYSSHYRTHTAKFICQVCKSRFKTVETLERHAKTHKEGEERPFICMEPDCGASFKKSGHLRSHQQFRHSKGEKNVHCDQCDYRCRQRYTLNSHMKTHYNLNPAKCYLCEHTCNSTSSLRQHMKFVHKETDPRIYCCTTCRRTFKYQKELHDHEKEHSPT